MNERMDEYLNLCAPTKFAACNLQIIKMLKEKNLVQCCLSVKFLPLTFVSSVVVSYNNFLLQLTIPLLPFTKGDGLDINLVRRKCQY